MSAYKALLTERDELRAEVKNLRAWLDVATAKNELQQGVIEHQREQLQLFGNILSKMKENDHEPNHAQHA